MGRRILIFGITFALLLICAVATLISFELSSMRRQGREAFSSAEQHLAEHKAELRYAIAEVLSKNQSGSRLLVESLPIALQIPVLQVAVVGDGHVTLVVYSNPDTDRGYRVWSDKQSSKFVDAATSIPGVYKFGYCDDLPESPTNRPPMTWGN